jgi:hypothetical protein
MKTFMKKFMLTIAKEGHNIIMLWKVMQRLMQNQELLFGTVIRLMIMIKELQVKDNKYKRKYM